MINSVQKNDVSFTSRPISKVRLKRLVNRLDLRPAEAHFSRMNPNNKEDQALIRKLKFNAVDGGDSSFGIKFFLNKFLKYPGKNQQYYALEEIEKSSFGKKILAFVNSKVLRENGQKTLRVAISANINPKDNISIDSVYRGVLAGMIDRAKARKVEALSFCQDSKILDVFTNAGISMSGKTRMSDALVEPTYVSNTQFDKFLDFCNKQIIKVQEFKIPARQDYHRA